MLATCMTYWSRTSSLGCSASTSMARLGGAAASLGRSEIGALEDAVESEPQERHGVGDRLSKGLGVVLREFRGVSSLRQVRHETSTSC